MSEKKIVVPEELFKAAQQCKEQIAKAALDAAVRWLSEHPPIVPTETSVHGYESPSPAPKPEVTEYTVSCQFCCGGFENIGPTFDGTSAARECCVCKGTGKRKQWRDSNGTYTRDPRLSNPDPEVSPFVQSVIKSFMGRTVAPHEADEIVKELGYVAHGWDFRRKS